MLENISLLAGFLYVVGLLLLIVEALVPGFGIAGISGIICVIVSIVMVTNSFFEVALMIIATVAIFMLAAILLYKLGIGKRVIGKLILKTEQSNNEGYTSVVDNKKYIGKVGIAATHLRSSGIVIVDNDRLDAVSEGGFIEKNTKIEIIRIEGRKIVVKETK